MAYFYVRTQKNKYDLDVVIDATGDAEYAAATANLDWTRLSKLDSIPPNGAYILDGNVITVDSDNYSLIADIIFNKEEEYKLENGISTEIEQLPDEIEYATSDAFDVETKSDDTDYGDGRNMPKPMALPILGVEPTPENYNHWWYNLQDIKALIYSLENNLVSDTDRIATLSSAPNYAVRFDGHIPDTKLEYPYPDDTLAEYIDFLKQQEGHMQKCVSDIALLLQIDAEQLAPVPSDGEEAPVE